MTAKNGYCTLDELQAHIPNSDNLNILQAENAIEAASRAIAMVTGRNFCPRIRTNLYDLPPKNELCLHDDLLEVIALTNGSGTVITDYRAWPYNWTPKASLMLNPATSTYWEESATSWQQAAISLLGVWGFHSDYGQAWEDVTTLSAGINSSVTAALCASVSGIYAGDIARIDNELFHLDAVTGGTKTITIKRAWNGSAAASHLPGASVKIWRIEPAIKRAALIQAARYYMRGYTIYGATGGGDMGVQAVAIPQLDPDVAAIVEQYKTRL